MLKKITTAGVLALATTGTLLIGTPAYAGVAHTSGRGGLLSGNQIIAPISIPINVCGNAVAVLGLAVGGCQGGAAAG
jgi:hypothetical protein